MKKAPKHLPRDEREERAHTLLARYEALSPKGKAAIDAIFKLGGDAELAGAVADASAFIDADLIEHARSAQGEAGSFSEMFDTISAVNGVIELLRVSCDNDEMAGEIEWCVVRGLINDCAERMRNVFSAAAVLADYEHCRDIKSRAREAVSR